MIFSQTAAVKQLDQLHPDVVNYQPEWEDLAILYQGGKTMADNIGRFLVKRPKEVGAVYTSRCSKATYSNWMSAIISHYTSRLFERDVEIHFKNSETGKSIEFKDGDFYSVFQENCDRGGKTFQSFMSDVAVDILLNGRTHILVDLPKLSVVPKNRAEQEALGGLSPYLVRYQPQEVINWQCDDSGEYNWVVIHTRNEVQAFLGEPLIVEKWYYYDKNGQYAIYQAKYPKNAQSKPQNADLVDQGIHCLASQGRLPLRTIQSDNVLWFGNRIYKPCCEYLNLENSLSWSLWMAAFPIPVFTAGKEGADVDANQVAAEYSALRLPENGKFEWAEVKGDSFKLLAEKEDSLREDIYRSCYLIAQGRSSKAQSTVQSGSSKEMDVQPSSEILNHLGDVVREAMQFILVDVAAVREDKIEPDVRGMSFEENGSLDQAQIIEAAEGVGIPSKTWKKEMQKKMARLTMPDANPDVLETVMNEIDAAPDEEPEQTESMISTGLRTEVDIKDQPEPGNEPANQ